VIQTKEDAAQALIAATLENPGKVCVTSSFQTECVALVHLLSVQRPDIPVLFLDTGYHFAETYAYRDQITDRLKLNLVNLLPAQTVAQQESQFGLLYQTDPGRCCGFRKVEPLFGAVSEYDVWFTGLRRDQSPTRANLKHSDDFQLPNGKKILKVSPLADWTTKDVWDYLKLHSLPVLPLYDRGYTSIGCEPCTSLPFDPDNPRSGRWSGQKLECGIHIAPK
jgi:phosphoadenosine phosphosulfate reductase